MSPGDKSLLFFFLSKVFHFRIKYHVAVHYLVTNGRFGTVGQYVEGGTYTYHVGGNGIGSIGWSMVNIYQCCVILQFQQGVNCDVVKSFPRAMSDQSTGNRDAIRQSKG
jgi:hypothetical protein